ncbi:hypothetical protein D3C87_1420020 [compost metagenome]
MGVLRYGQERLDLGHAQELGRGLVGARQQIVCHGLAATGIEVRKEACFTFDVSFFKGEGQAVHPTLLQHVLVEFADVNQALAGGVWCQLARHQAIVPIGRHKALGLATINVAPIQFMGLEEAEEVVQSASCTGPGPLRTNDPAK